MPIKLPIELSNKIFADIIQITKSDCPKTSFHLSNAKKYYIRKEYKNVLNECREALESIIFEKLYKKEDNEIDSIFYEFFKKETEYGLAREYELAREHKDIVFQKLWQIMNVKNDKQIKKDDADFAVLGTYSIISIMTKELRK